MTKNLLTSLFLLSSLFSFGAFACNQTYRGKEVDRHIKVKNLGDHSYEIIVPKKLNHLDYGVRMSVHYYRSGDVLQIVEKEQKLLPKLVGQHYTATSKILPEAGLIPYVSVLWQPEVCCECPAIGRSGDIQL